MILLDSNIVIYLYNPQFGPAIAAQLADQSLATCNVVIAEVLGYSQLTDQQATAFQQFLVSLRNLPFDEAVTSTVIDLRRRYRLQLPDAIIAATALTQQTTLWTHNVDDFAMIDGLQMFDPLS